MKYISSKNKTTLDSIAYQCPLHGGDGVYIARGLLAGFNQLDSLNDSTLCVTVSESKGEDVTMNEISEIQVFPNPSRGEITIILPNLDLGSQTISIFSSSGQKVHEGNLSSGQTIYRINMDNFPEGIYFGTVVSVNNSESQFKIVIQK